MIPRLTRRDAILVGAGAFGLSLPRLLQAETVTDRNASIATRAGRAKSVIILYLSGGPSQLDMWDMKPHASEEIRGTFQPTRTTVAGVHICEHLPRMARLADKYTIVRSMTHDEADHLRAGYWVMTGGRLLRPITAYSGMERTDRPHVGGIVSKLRPAQGLPSFVVVPEFVSPREVARPGQHAGFLGAGFDPYAIESDPSQSEYNAGPLSQPSMVSFGRLQQRRDLLHSLERVSHTSYVSADARSTEAARASAFDLVTSTRSQQAFDLSRESSATRARYGDHAFGQSALVALRLVEAGVRVVQVNFPRHDHRPAGQGYDSHSSPPNPPHLAYAQQRLLPPTDAAFSSLVEDLADRGMLDETLVVMMGEFGRTPQFNPYGGRDHWPGCYSLVVAGGGTVAGGVYGASDRFAATPVRDPVSPDDLLATIYHLLGIDPQGELRDMDDRPIRIADGKPVMGLIA
jgi:hypothetical protein